MLNNEDDERKKRLEEAMNIISRNNTYNDTQYDTKLQEANNIINSINPSKTQEISDMQRTESINNANEFISLLDKNEDYKSSASGGITVTTYEEENNPRKITQEDKKNDIDHIKEVNNINVQPTVNTQNTFRTSEKITIPNNVSVASNNVEDNIVKIDQYDIKAQNESLKRNKEIQKGGVDKFNATVETILKNVQGGVMNAVSGLANVITTATALGARSLEGWSYILGSKDTSKNLNDFYNKTVDTGENLSDKAGYESNVTSRIENDNIKTAGMVTNVISEMASNAAIGYILPGGTTGNLGTAIQGLSVGGRSAQEVLNENKDNIKQATITGIAKGFTSYLTEKMFDANILTKGNPSSISDKVDDLIFNNIKSKFGAKFASKTVGIIGENIEELAEDNIGNLIDYIVNDKDFPTIKDWWSNTSETAKVTTISTIIMSMLGLGGSDFENRQENYLTRKVEKYIEDNSLSIQYEDFMNQETNKNSFFITNFNQDGNIENIQSVKGKSILNPNKKVQVNPVIINNNGNYNIIDGNTGILLDSAPYRTIIEAESRFNNKMINLDNTSIQNINNKINQANYAIDNKFKEIVSSAQSEIAAQENVEATPTVETSMQTPLENVEDSLQNGQENVENSISTNLKSQSNITNSSIENKPTLNMIDRNFENVSDTKVKAYQEEHPEIQSEMQEMAIKFMEDLANTSEGKRYKVGDEWSGQKRSTTKELAQIKDSTGATWNQIGQSLEDIANNKGNYALAKKIEIVLDDTLTNGYKNIYGQVIMPNEEYLAKKSKIEAVQQNKINEDNNLDNYRVFDEDTSKSKKESVNKANLIKDKGDISSVSGSKQATERNDISPSNTSISQNSSSVKNNTVQNNENNTLEDIKKELHNRIQNAILSKNSRKNTFLGTVSDKVASKIKSLFDIDVSGRKHIITDYDIRHIIKQHGNSEIEKTKGQIAVTPKDIEKIPDIIEKYDEIIEGNNNKQGKTIRYIKNYPDNKTYVVEVIPNANDKTLYIKTMWKKPITLTNSQKTPSSTSKTRGNSSSSTSNTSISQNEQNVKGNTNIQDFGEKIGGARKDISVTRGTVNTKQVTHDYAVKNTDAGFAVTFKNNILKDGFQTQAEAEKYIMDFKNDIKSNLAFVKDFKNKDNEKYLVYIRNPRTLKSTYAGKEFTNKQDAENYAMALSMYLKEYGKALERPSIQKVSRINVKNKNATKTTGNDILNNFGFKGGEFGNWVKQSERQEFLNYAQDAFTDLAEALDIDPISLGQNGEMNIAFGARGRGNLGGQAAVAHFEPGKRVINMTKLKGAGSLAHEYGHSIDNWLSRISGYSETGMATTNPRNPNLSDKMKAAIKDAIDAMQYNVSTNQAEINKKNQLYEGNRKKSLEYHLKSIDNIFSGNATKYKRVKGEYQQVLITVTEQQKQEYQKIRNTLMNGEITEDIEYKSDPRTLKTEKIYPEPIAKLQKMYKEIVGRKLDEDNTVYWLYRYGKPTKQVSEVKSESAYMKSAIELDRLTGRASKYFSTTEEMWARAFEAYISDKLKQKGITDTYLVHSVNNTDYALFNPYPAGEERININKAFDNLIKTMKDEEILKAKKQKPSVQDNGIRYEKIKGKSNISTAYNAKENEGNIDIIKSINQNNYLKNLTDIDNEQGATNAQSVDRRIEQEIREVEGTGSFDDTIPVTKLTDINNMIKEFLGTHIQKGHFRQRVYGFYNPNTNTIRVKENKDMDNILHEMGHVLDLNKKINLNKDTIATELITATNKHGGYENDSKSVQMEEGFAEIIKEYAINPMKVKTEYPQTYSILNAERQQNQKFDSFMSKLQTNLYNYIHQNPKNRILSNMSIGEQTDKAPITPNLLKEKIIKTVWDKGYPVKSMANELAKASGKKLSEIEPSKNIYLLTRLASGINNKAISMISDGYIDLNGVQTMPGLNKIGDILGNNANRWNDLRAYLVAKRDLEYKAKSLKTGIRTIDSKAVIEQFKNDTQIQEASQIVYDTLDGVLQYAVDNGLISQEIAKSLKESNAFYVPFQRVLEGKGNQTGRRGAVADIIKRRTGSELDIKDVLENIVVNSSNIIQQVENNNVLRTLYEQGEEAGMKNNIFEEIPTPMTKIGTEKLSTWETELKKQGIDTSKLDLEKTIDLFVPNNKIITEKDGSHVVSFFDKDGKRKYLQFYNESTDIFNAIMGMDGKLASMVLNITSKANMPLRYGATMANIGFAIPNLIADTAQATIYSEAGFVPIVDNVIGVLDVLVATNENVKNFISKFNSEYTKRMEHLYTLYQQTGASSSTRLSQYRKSTQEIMKDIYGTKSSKDLGIKDSFKPLKRFLDIITYIPELSENSTRFRVFERNYEAYKNKGGSELDARIKGAIESKDATQDFGRTGTFMREVNKIIPFSAARVGSAYTFSEKISTNFKRTATRIAILTAIAMTIKAIGYDDKEIEELNQRKKDDNFVFKIGNSIITLKKPQGILRSIVNLVEYIQDLATGHIEKGKEGERLGEWLSNALKDNLSADSPLAAFGSVPIVGGLAENAANKDFYFNTDIVKSWDLDLPEEQQYYDYTSRLAIALGQLFNYSPAKIDNLISSYFGSLGTQVTNIIDYISGKMGMSAEEPAMGIEDNAVGKRFVVNVNENSASIDEIYDREEELTKKLNGGTITDEESKELANLEEALTKLSALNKQIKVIKQDLTMSSAEKADKIRPLQEQKTDVARQALGKETIYTENAEELESLKFYPNKSELNYNGLALVLTEEMKQEYKDLAYNIYKKYEKQGIYSEEYLKKLESKSKDYAKKTIMQKYKNQLEKNNK